jgi:hypothetical protein
MARKSPKEMICYCFISLHNSKLPWDRNKLNLPHIIYLSKLGMSTNRLCTKCIGEFAIFMKYYRSLSIEERPDYDYLINLMKKVIEHHLLHKTYNLQNLSKLLHKRNRQTIRNSAWHINQSLFSQRSQLLFFVRSKHVDSHEYSSTSPEEIETSKSNLPTLSLGMRPGSLNLSRIY